MSLEYHNLGLPDNVSFCFISVSSCESISSEVCFPFDTMCESETTKFAAATWTMSFVYVCVLYWTFKIKVWSELKILDPDSA